MWIFKGESIPVEVSSQWKDPEMVQPGMGKERKNESSEPRLVLATRRAVDKVREARIMEGGVDYCKAVVFYSALNGI